MHVVDASRAVGVAGGLVSDTQRTALIERMSDEYETLRANHAGKSARSERISIAEARDRGHALDWAGYSPPKPQFLERDRSRIIRWTCIGEPHRLDPVLPDMGTRCYVSCNLG